MKIKSGEIRNEYNYNKMAAYIRYRRYLGEVIGYNINRHYFMAEGGNTPQNKHMAAITTHERHLLVYGEAIRFVRLSILDLRRINIIGVLFLYN